MGLKIGFFFNSALPNLIIKDRFFKNLLGICGGSPQNLVINDFTIKQKFKQVLHSKYNCTTHQVPL